MSAGYMRKCARKKRFDSKAEAMRARMSLVAACALRPDQLNTYRCNQCLGYHNGNVDHVNITRERRAGKRLNRRMRGR